MGYAGAIGASLGIAPIAAVSFACAMPNTLAQMQIAPDNSAGIHKVIDGRHFRRGKEWRRGHWRRHHDRYDNDFDPGAYIAFGVIGALINQGRAKIAPVPPCSGAMTVFAAFSSI
jgi:hypothetical protein